MLNLRLLGKCRQSDGGLVHGCRRRLTRHCNWAPAQLAISSQFSPARKYGVATLERTRLRHSGMTCSLHCNRRLQMCSTHKVFGLVFDCSLSCNSVGRVGASFSLPCPACTLLCQKFVMCKFLLTSHQQAANRVHNTSNTCCKHLLPSQVRHQSTHQGLTTQSVT